MNINTCKGILGKFEYLQIRRSRWQAPLDIKGTGKHPGPLKVLKLFWKFRMKHNLRGKKTIKFIFNGEKSLCYGNINDIVMQLLWTLQ